MAYFNKQRGLESNQNKKNGVNQCQPWLNKFKSGFHFLTFLEPANVLHLWKYIGFCNVSVS